MGTTLWPANFETIVSSRLFDPPPPGRLDPALDLQAAGIDSLETIGLMVELESTFDVVLPDELLTIETFSSPSKLWSALESCLSGSAE